MEGQHGGVATDAHGSVSSWDATDTRKERRGNEPNGAGVEQQTSEASPLKQSGRSNRIGRIGGIIRGHGLIGARGRGRGRGTALARGRGGPRAASRGPDLEASRNGNQAHGSNANASVGLTSPRPFPRAQSLSRVKAAKAAAEKRQRIAAEEQHAAKEAVSKWQAEREAAAATLASVGLVRVGEGMSHSTIDEDRSPFVGKDHPHLVSEESEESKEGELDKNDGIPILQKFSMGDLPKPEKSTSLSKSVHPRPIARGKRTLKSVSKSSTYELGKTLMKDFVKNTKTGTEMESTKRRRLQEKLNKKGKKRKTRKGGNIDSDGNGEGEDGAKDDYSSSNLKNETSLEESPKTFAPSLQIDEHGNIVINKDSLVVASEVSKPSVEGLKEGGEDVSRTTSASFSKRKPSTRWTKEETKKFYHALRQCGSDFTLIAEFFPNRTRSQIKAKFKREEKEHGNLVSIALDPSAAQPLQLTNLSKDLEEKVEAELRNMQNGTSDSNADVVGTISVSGRKPRTKSMSVVDGNTSMESKQPSKPRLRQEQERGPSKPDHPASLPQVESKSSALAEVVQDDLLDEEDDEEEDEEEEEDSALRNIVSKQRSQQAHADEEDEY